MIHLIHNARVITPTTVIEAGWIAWEGTHIVAIGRADERPPDGIGRWIDGQGAYLLPGFIDLHVHGALGHDTMDADADALIAVAKYFAQHGVTRFVPTTITSSTEATLQALHAVQVAMARDYVGAKIVGAHLEGPYLNPTKAGAQNTAWIRRADPQEALQWLDTGIIKVISLAPEYPENDWLIEACHRRGVVVSAAHTDATYAQMQHAQQLGLSQITHTFNGMRGMHHREPGVVGAAFNLSDLYCELIADNTHVHPAVMDILWKIKGVSHIILITDSTRGTGMPDGQYDIGGQVFYMKDTEARLADGTLAGSTATMDQVVSNFATLVGGLPAMWQTSSHNAACQLGIEHETGALVAGKVADVVLMGDDGRILLTVCNGRLCHLDETIVLAATER